MASASVPQLIHAGNPGPLTGAGNNTWLLDGLEPTLIDAGTGNASHIEAVARALGKRPLARVLATHGHPDHIEGLAALRDAWPGLDARKFPQPGESGWRPLVDGERVRAGDTDLAVIHTPGHAPDHVCFWNAAPGDLFAGDMVLDGTTVMIPAGRGGNLRDYLLSLERLLSLQPKRIFPGHGPVIDRPVAAIRQYLEHRRMREAQVLASVEAGATGVDAIVGRIYPNLADELRAAARLTVQAHLDKLREEGRLSPNSRA